MWALLRMPWEDVEQVGGRRAQELAVDARIQFGHRPQVDLLAGQGVRLRSGGLPTESGKQENGREQQGGEVAARVEQTKARVHGDGFPG